MIKIFNIVSILIWFGLFFITSMHYEGNFLGNFLNYLQYYFITSASGGFPGFEVLLMLFVIITILTFNRKFIFYKQNKIISSITIAFLLFFVFAYLNPNNTIENWYSFFSMRISRTLILFFFLLITINSLSINNYIHFLRIFIKIGFIICIIKTSLDLFLFLLGFGPINSFGKKVVIMGGDILSWISILSILSFVIYEINKQKKFLFFSGMFFLCLLFSYQRTSLLTTTIFIGLFHLFSLIKEKPFKFKFFLQYLFLGLIIILSFSIFINSTKIGRDIFYRNYAVFESVGIVEENMIDKPEYSDSGHLLQSKKTTQYLIKNRTNFWGGGINKRTDNYLYIEGQSQGGVHCNIVSLWQYFGIPGVLFIISIFIINFHFFIKHFIFKSISSNSILLLAISLYFIIRIIIGWFSGDFFYMYSQISFQYILLLSIYKIYNKKVDINLLFIR